MTFKTSFVYRKIIKAGDLPASIYLTMLITNA